MSESRFPIFTLLFSIKASSFQIAFIDWLCWIDVASFDLSRKEFISIRTLFENNIFLGTEQSFWSCDQVVLSLCPDLVLSAWPRWISTFPLLRLSLRTGLLRLVDPLQVDQLKLDLRRLDLRRLPGWPPDSLSIHYNPVYVLSDPSPTLCHDSEQLPWSWQERPLKGAESDGAQISKKRHDYSSHVLAQHCPLISSTLYL